MATTGNILRLLALFPMLIFGTICFATGSSGKNEGDVFDPNAYAANGPANKREYNIHYSFLGRGEPGSLKFLRRRFYASRWIYVPAGKGKWSAQEIVVTTRRGKLSFPNAISDLKGYVEVREDTLIVALQLPVQPDGNNIVDYKAFDQNGEYRITEKTAPPSPDENAPVSGN